jgi:predicted DNA-binding transcriptional regulator YafY
VQGAEPDTWVFSASIFDLKPLAHFILGFPDDVRILEGKELKQHILQQVNRILQQ